MVEGERMSAATLPWPQDRRPLSVVVFGNSLPVLQMPARPDRESGVYLEVLADRLAAAGVPVSPHLEARWFDFLVDGMADYQSRVRAHVPDVLIVHYGLNEYQPWLVPIWLIRHFLRQQDAVVRPARAYRTHVSPRLWRQVRNFRRWAAPRVGLRTWQTTPGRFAGHLARLIQMARWELAPLVLVLDLDEPGELLEHFLPGVSTRREIFQRTLEQVVAQADDPDVRLVRVSAITSAMGAAAMPDGMHYTAAAHRAVGERLAEEVIGWLRERPGR